MTALADIQPMHVAAWIEELGHNHAVPTVKLRLATIRHLFDWMVTGQIMRESVERTHFSAWVEA